MDPLTYRCVSYTSNVPLKFKYPPAFAAAMKLAMASRDMETADVVEFRPGVTGLHVHVRSQAKARAKAKAEGKKKKEKTISFNASKRL